MKILITFRNMTHFDNFSVQEFEALIIPYLEELNITFQQLYQYENILNGDYLSNYSFKNFPYIIIEFPRQHIKVLEQICQRSVLIESFSEVLYEAKNLEELLKVKFTERIIDLQKITKTVSVQFFSFAAKVKQEKQHEIIFKINTYFQIGEKTQFKDPDTSLIYQEINYKPEDQNEDQTKKGLKHVVLSVSIANNKQFQKTITKYTLGDRPYLGPTTMDHNMSFVMCNLVNIQQSDFVYDPFVGTGGLLLPTAYFGCVSIGSDLDSRVLHGTGVGRINQKSKFIKENKDQANFSKINLNFLEKELMTTNLVRMDCVKNEFVQRKVFDCILADPPYGVRAMCRSIKDKKSKESMGKDLDNAQSIIEVDVNFVVEGLLNIAKRNLKKGGNMVFFYPMQTQKYEEVYQKLPVQLFQKNDFKLINYCMDLMSAGRSRILVILKNMI